MWSNQMGYWLVSNTSLTTKPDSGEHEQWALNGLLGPPAEEGLDEKSADIDVYKFQTWMRFEIKSYLSSSYTRDWG